MKVRELIQELKNADKSGMRKVELNMDGLRILGPLDKKNGGRVILAEINIEDR